MINTIIEFAENYPLFKISKQNKLREIKKEFGKFFSEEELNDWYCFCSFFLKKPQKYLNANLIKLFLKLLNKDKKSACLALTTFEKEITHSVLTLLKQTNENYNEDRVELNSINDHFLFENEIHPQYFKYTESVYNHLISIPLYLLGRKNNKNYISLSFSNRLEKLNELDFNVFTTGCDSMVRNSLAHGDYRYIIHQIEYNDKNKKITYFPNDVRTLLDDLIQTCNSLLFSIMLFVCKEKEYLQNNSSKCILPEGINLLLLKGIVDHEDFQIDSIMLNNYEQLILIISSKSKYRFEHILYSVFIAYECYKINKNFYKRLGLSINFGKKVNAQVYINMSKFVNYIQANGKLDGELSFFEETMNWYDPKSKVPKYRLRKLLLKESWKYAKKDLKNSFAKINPNSIYKIYNIRKITPNVSDKTLRLDVYVSLNDVEDIDLNFLVHIVDLIIKDLKNKKFKIDTLRKKLFFKRKPQYIWIRLYRKDNILRKLYASGWKEKNQLLRIEWIRNSHNPRIFIREPDIILKDRAIHLNPELKW